MENIQKTTGNYEAVKEQFPLPAEYIAKLRASGSETHIEAYERLLDIAKVIEQAGGRGLLVGGCVRDTILGRISKDFDLEVYKLNPETLESLLMSRGKIYDIGKSFGVLKISFGEGIDIDVSLPRTDSKIGVGHRGFEVKADPNMSIAEAAKRRDFTINSMAADPLTGEIFDPFGGIKDLKAHCLRITDVERFKDDPLRVLRAMQFIARFLLRIEPESAKVIQEMAPLLNELPEERIFEEWKKLLLKAEKPSLGLQFGKEMGILHVIFPELAELENIPQDPKWHPEGNVWVHTMLCVDSAATIIRREKLEERVALVIMISSLTHDIGKARVTEKRNGRYISHGHEAAGEEATRKFLKSIRADNLTYAKVLKLVSNHLAPALFYEAETKRGEKVTDGAIRRLAKRLYPSTIYELVLLAEADHSASGQPVDIAPSKTMPLSSYFPVGDWLLKRAQHIQVDKKRPENIVMGRDLLQLGYKPGPYIGILIDLANQLRDERNFTRESILRSLVHISDEEKAIETLKRLLQNKL